MAASDLTHGTTLSKAEGLRSFPPRLIHAITAFARRKVRQTHRNNVNYARFRDKFRGQSRLVQAGVPPLQVRRHSNEAEHVLNASRGPEFI